MVPSQPLACARLQFGWSKSLQQCEHSNVSIPAATKQKQSLLILQNNLSHWLCNQLNFALYYTHDCCYSMFEMSQLLIFPLQMLLLQTTHFSLEAYSTGQKQPAILLGSAKAGHFTACLRLSVPGELLFARLQCFQLCHNVSTWDLEVQRKMHVPNPHCPNNL